MSRIFCVEDDSNIRELIEYTLSSSGFEVEGFENGDLFFRKLSCEIPDLVLLDIMLPDKDGMEILKELRSKEETKDICVILLTAKSERMDKIRGLNSGADDYITKPFDVLELISRVNALLRRSTRTKTTSDNTITRSGITLDTGKRLVYTDEGEVNLTYKEFELLWLLMNAGGSVVTRESIISKVWDTDFEGESRTLDVHIRSLRQKLGNAGSCIDTVRNVGYKLD